MTESVPFLQQQHLSQDLYVRDIHVDLMLSVGKWVANGDVPACLALLATPHTVALSVWYRVSALHSLPVSGTVVQTLAVAHVVSKPSVKSSTTIQSVVVSQALQAIHSLAVLLLPYPKIHHLPHPFHPLLKQHHLLVILLLFHNLGSQQPSRNLFQRFLSPLPHLTTLAFQILVVPMQNATNRDIIMCVNVSLDILGILNLGVVLSAYLILIAKKACLVRTKNVLTLAVKNVHPMLSAL